MKNNSTMRIVLCALFATLSTLAFMLENLFPPLFIPGAKLGLSNVFILLSALTLGGGYAFITLAVKTLLGSLFSGNVSAIMYSLPAGLIALSIQLALIYYVKNISVVCASVAGAVVNTTIQNTVFCLITATAEYFAFLPYLALIGTFSGLIVGFTVFLLLRRLKRVFAKYGLQG